MTFLHVYALGQHGGNHNVGNHIDGNHIDANHDDNYIVGDRRSLLDNKTTNDRQIFDFTESPDMSLLPVNQLERRITDFNPSLATNKKVKEPLSSLIKKHFDKIDQSLEMLLSEEKIKELKGNGEQRQAGSKSIAPYKISSIRGIVVDNGTHSIQNAEQLKKSEQLNEHSKYLDLQQAKLRVLGMAKELEKYHSLHLKEATPVDIQPKPDQVLVLVAEPLAKPQTIEPIELSNNKLSFSGGVVRQFNLPALNKSNLLADDENYIPLEDSTSSKNESKNEAKANIQSKTDTLKVANETTKTKNEIKNETSAVDAAKQNNEIKNETAEINSGNQNETAKTYDDVFAVKASDIKNDTSKSSVDTVAVKTKDDIKNKPVDDATVMKAKSEIKNDTAKTNESNAAGKLKTDFKTDTAKAFENSTVESTNSNIKIGTGKIYDSLTPVKETSDIKNDTVLSQDGTVKLHDDAITEKATNASSSLISSAKAANISEGTVRSIMFENSSHPIHDDVNKYDIYLKDLADKKGGSSGKRITVNAADQEVSFQIKQKIADETKFATPILNEPKEKASKDTASVINLSVKAANDTDTALNYPQIEVKNKPENATQGVTLVGYSNASTFEYDDAAMAKGAAKATYIDKSSGAKQAKDTTKSNDFEKSIDALDFWSAEPKTNQTSVLKKNSTLKMPKNNTLANITDTIKDIVDSINLIPSVKNDSIENNVETATILPPSKTKDSSFGMLSKPIYDTLDDYEKTNTESSNLAGSHHYEDQLDQSTDIPANFYVPPGNQHEPMETTPSQYINLGSDERITQSLKPFLDQQFRAPQVSTFGSNVATNGNANLAPSLDEYEIVITNLTKGGDIILKKKQPNIVNSTATKAINQTFTYQNQTASAVLNEIVNQEPNPKKSHSKRHHKKKHHIKGTPQGIPKFIKVHFDEQPSYGGGYNEAYNRDDNEEDDRGGIGENEEENEQDGDEPTNDFVNRNMFNDDEMERDKENEYNQERMDHMNGYLGRKNYQTLHDNENENENEEAYPQEPQQPPTPDVNRYSSERYNNMPPIPQMMQKEMRLFNTSSSESQYGPTSEVGVEIPQKVDITSETGEARFNPPTDPSNDPYMTEPSMHIDRHSDAALTQNYLSHVGGRNDAMVTPGISFTNNLDTDTGADSVINSNVVMNHLEAHLINLVESDNTTKNELQEDINKYLGDCNGFRDKCHYIDPKSNF